MGHVAGMADEGWAQNLTVADHSEAEDGRIILKLILGKLCGKAGTRVLG
jgi:hypothetical protein